MKRFWLLFLLPVGIWCSPSKGLAQESGRFRIRIPYLEENGKLIVTAFVNGVPGRFIVDTGAPCCVSHSFAEKAGIRDEGRTAQGVDSNGAAVSTSVVNIPSLKLDSVFTFTRLQAMKWAEGDMLENLHIDGVIGYNLLKQGILKLDARTGSMTFTNYDGGLGIDYTRAIPMLPDSYLTLLRVQLKDGACDTVMSYLRSPAFWAPHRCSSSKVGSASEFCDDTSAFWLSTIWAPAFSWGLLVSILDRISAILF